MPMKCGEPGCEIQPSFNEEGGKRKYCGLHKQDGMVNVKNGSCACIYPECHTRASYNIEGLTKGIYCSSHKLDGMMNVNSKICIHLECKTQAMYNINGEKTGLYCAKHKLEGMVDIKNKSCKSEWCFTLVRDKNEGYCLHCYVHLFPENPRAKNYKTKEYAVVEYIKNVFPDLSWVSDKMVSGGCSKRRPDLLLDLGYQILIVEIDENQHTRYDCSCENKRLMELSLDLSHRPIVFIRFNPDDFDENGTSVASCWGLDKKGFCVVKKSKQEEWTQRLNTLKEQIVYWLDSSNVSNKTIEIIQLFYDV